jgi:hypothetical protein
MARWVASAGTCLDPRRRRIPSVGHPWPATPILAGHQGALHAHNPRSERRWRPIHRRRGFESGQTNSPGSSERRCHLARLRRLLVALAVAALLLVATATTALAGLTATAVD